MKKTLLLTLALFIGLSGVVYAAEKWNGFQVMKVLYAGKELKVTDAPPVIIKGRTFVPLYMLREIGLGVTLNGKAVTVTLPPATAPEKPTVPLKKPLTLDQLKMLNKHTVAMIYALDDNGNNLTQGSGFVVTSDGLLLTANHVVEEKGVYQNLKVILDGNTYLVSKNQIVHKDAEHDIAAIRIPEDLYDYIPLGNDDLKEKDAVISLGFPKGKSAIVQGKVYLMKVDSISVNTFLDGGTSGGPLIDQYGELVGVVQRGGDPGLQISGALKISVIANLIK